MGNKRIYLLLHLLILSGIAGAQQKPFTLTGTIKEKTGSYMYLSYPADDAATYKTDSALISNGKFSFKGALSGPVHAALSRSSKLNMAERHIELFLVPGNMEISLDYDNLAQSAVLKGSPVHAEHDALEKSKAVITAQMKLLIETHKKAYLAYKDAEKAKEEEAILDCLKAAADGVKEAIHPLQQQLIKMDIAYLDQHPTSFLTAYKLRDLIVYMPSQKAQERYNRLPGEIKRSSVGKDIKGKLDELGKGAPGVPAFQFASTELRGDQLKLSAYKGKYVLLDFWASWCVPCRKGNPHLLSLYATYKGKGLEVIGIASDDKKPEAWKKAIQKDGIAVWKHVLNEKLTTPEGGSYISSLYGIATLPTKILIDPQGIIIGRYSADGESDEALDKKLAAVFGSDRQ